MARTVSRPAPRPKPLELDPRGVDGAYERLARADALPTLVRGGLPQAVLKRLLRDALPRRTAAEMPPEIWASLAVGIALESPDFAWALAERLHDHLGWDRTPLSLDDWWPAVRERPLEALWMAALAGDKAVRKEFVHIAEHCLENYRQSPECQPPSWAFVDGLLDVHARQQREQRQVERELDEAQRRLETERERVEEQREELKRLRRENVELRTGRAQIEREAQKHAERAAAQAESADAKRFAELERRLRLAEKQREHLLAELGRASSPAAAEPAAPPEPGSLAAAAPDEAQEAEHVAIAADPNPRRRVLRQVVRKLFKKGKIGASHTHEDNVYRGVADHEKGLAKQGIELLYREGWFMPKPTTADPHVSLNPEHLAELRALVAGELLSPRLQAFIEE